MKTVNRILDITKKLFHESWLFTLIIITLMTFNLFVLKISLIDGKLGDINHDGEVSITDAVIVNRALNGKVQAIDYKYADMDGDKQITQQDLKLIEDIILGR